MNSEYKHLFQSSCTTHMRTLFFRKKGLFNVQLDPLILIKNGWFCFEVYYVMHDRSQICTQLDKYRNWHLILFQTQDSRPQQPPNTFLKLFQAASNQRISYNDDSSAVQIFIGHKRCPRFGFLVSVIFMFGSSYVWSVPNWCGISKLLLNFGCSIL